MGTALRFNEEARACAAAYFLAAQGHGVLWDPVDQPTLVTTSAHRSVVRVSLLQFKGVDEEWFKRERVDCNIRHLPIGIDMRNMFHALIRFFRIPWRRRKLEDQKCVQTVFERVGDHFQPRQCTRRGGHGPNGEYCRMHDPGAAEREKDCNARAFGRLLINAGCDTEGKVKTLLETWTIS